MTTLNREIAEQGAVAGMVMAASHADRETEDWSKEAMSYFRLFAAMNKGKSFLTEEVRSWAEKMGFETPPDNRAWGFVARRAATEGVVRKLGYAAQKSVTCHGSPKTLWTHMGSSI